MLEAKCLAAHHYWERCEKAHDRMGYGKINSVVEVQQIVRGCPVLYSGQHPALHYKTLLFW